MVRHRKEDMKELEGRENTKNKKLTRQNKEQKTDQRAIPQIQHIPRDAPQTNLTNPINQRIQKDIQRARARAVRGHVAG